MSDPARAFSLPTAPTYALYVGPDDLYVEMGVVYVLPHAGDVVQLGTDRYRVVRIEWELFNGPANGPCYSGVHPQQHATIVLRSAEG